jgi:hypothetical protein
MELGEVIVEERGGASRAENRRKMNGTVGTVASSVIDATNVAAAKLPDCFMIMQLCHKLYEQCLKKY